MMTIGLVPRLREVLFKPDAVRRIDQVIDYFGEKTAGEPGQDFEWTIEVVAGLSPPGDRPGPADRRSAGS